MQYCSDRFRSGGGRAAWRPDWRGCRGLVREDLYLSVPAPYPVTRGREFHVRDGHLMSASSQCGSCFPHAELPEKTPVHPAILRSPILWHMGSLYSGQNIGNRVVTNG